MLLGVNYMKEAAGIIESCQPLWGSWKVEELIYQGSGCEVYRVYKEEWGRRYVSAVKHMSFTLGRSDMKEAQAIGIAETAMPEYYKSVVGSIHNEIELMYKLRGNSNIVTYEDHSIYMKKGDLGWDILIRMEYLRPLPDFLAGREPCRSEVLRLGIDICKALEACGREGIIHRDIRDSSIFVSDKGEFKLGSFSLAKDLVKGGRMAAAQFNPLYMAPELYKEQSYDSSIDIYSLGILMYKLLNRGRLPFMSLPPAAITVADTERALALRMSGEELVPPADAGENLGSAILKACSYDKKDRYKSPYEFRQKLERILKAELKPARQESPITNCTEECAAGSEEQEGSHIPAVKEEADARAAYEEELEKLAVVELVSSIDKINNEKRLASKKFMRSLALWASLMAAAFILAFISSYEIAPLVEEKADIAVKAAPSPTEAPVMTPSPATVISGEQYYLEGLELMKNKRYTVALPVFEEAKRLGYDKAKVDSQIRAIKKHTDVKIIYEKAAGYYERKDYEKAITAFAELSGIDTSYSASGQYAESFFQLAAKHNSLGMQYFNEGKLELSVKEFEAALELLDNMKNNVKGYDADKYSSQYGIYSQNKGRLLEKVQRVEERFKLADSCNKAGVSYFSKSMYSSARLEFEKALKHMEEIRLLVPNYSSDSYDGLLQIYKGNLGRTEEKLWKNGAAGS